MVDGEYSRERAAEVARAMCAGPHRPDAIFVGNDHMAFAVIDELVHRMGLRVPEDISIVGYDDVPMAAWPAYDLTTIRQPVEEMVDATVEMLLGQIEGDTEPHHHRIDGPLVVRRSARIPEGTLP
jgi:DNA-binding LacI/PurR family transcriptional regulator